MTSASRALDRHTTSRATRRYYRRPPVLEALVDIKVGTLTETTPEALGGLYVGEETRYPKRETVRSSTVTVEGGAGQAIRATQSEQEFIGHRWLTSQGNVVVQVRRDGFTFSRLRPYSRWEEWRNEARRLWEKYRLAVGAEAVSRMAVRYINRIDIPHHGPFDLADYLTARPEMPNAPLLRATGLLMRLEFSVPELEQCTLILTLARVDTPPDPAIGLSLLLDLDLFQTLRLSASAPALWNYVEALHEYENRLFEAFITDRAREIFDQ